MLSYAEAHKLIVNSIQPLESVNLPLPGILNHVLFESIIAPFELPQFDNSAVDGFGVLVEDLKCAESSSPVELKLVASLEAGTKTDGNKCPISRGQCIKILTGAPVPAGVEA